MTRVLIVDDQDLVRSGLRMILEMGGLDVVGEASDGAAAVAAVEALAPDVVLMDLRMPGMDGVEATRRLTARGELPRILVLTTFDLDEYVYAALRAGASGFMLKDTPPELLLAAIRDVYRGDSVVAPSATRRMLERFADALPSGDDELPDPRLAELTEREREVLVLIGEGLSNSEIAERLVLAEATVKTHIGRVLAKTGSRDRVQLVVLAYDAGLVRPRSR